MKLESITIIQQFYNVVEKRKDCIAVTYEGESYTWEEIDTLSDKMAMALLYEKVQRGAHIAICGDNSLGWICAFLSILKVGATAILLNPRFKELEALKLLHHADVEYIYYDDTFAEEKSDYLKMRAIGKSFGKSTMDVIKDIPSVPSADKEKLRKRQMETNPKDIACMLFTSGTTSTPKGVMLSHYQLINVAREATETMSWTAEDKICLALPMFHCFGLSTGLLSAFVHGGSLHLSRGRKSPSVMGCIEENGCTVLNAVPSLFLAILYSQEREKYHLSTLRSGIIAGSEVHTEDFHKIRKELGMKDLMQSYGQTEASPSITFTSFKDSLEVRSKSVGKKISNTELKIISLDKEEDLKPCQKGEIVIKGYHVMKGYYKNETETRAVLSSDGWLKTGDIGYLDEDGNLYVTGRKKDIIIRCGENISPREIEEAILSINKVVQVKVFGVPAPVVQEEIAACIEMADTAEAEGNPDDMLQEEAIRKYLKERLANYKIPKYIFLYKHLPVNASGKIDIKELKEETQIRIKPFPRRNGDNNDFYGTA